MTKAVRVEITRPDLDTQWPYEAFGDAITSSSQEYVANAWDNKTYVTGWLGLKAFVDHVFTNDSDLDNNYDTIMASLPWWKRSDNVAAVEQYIADNNITVKMSVVENPDHTESMEVTHFYRMDEPDLTDVDGTVLDSMTEEEKEKALRAVDPGA